MHLLSKFELRIPSSYPQTTFQQSAILPLRIGHRTLFQYQSLICPRNYRIWEKFTCKFESVFRDQWYGILQDFLLRIERDSECQIFYFLAFSAQRLEFLERTLGYTYWCNNDFRWNTKGLFGLLIIQRKFDCTTLEQVE